MNSRQKPQDDVQNQLDTILYKGHPAFGTCRAAYQFLIVDTITQLPTRFIIIEANNPWAVMTIERILLRDGKVSDNCRIMAVFRDHRVLGTRDRLMEEIPYVDFILDIVDSSFLIKDTVVSSCFSNSLTNEERAYALNKVQTYNNTSQPIHAPYTGTDGFNPNEDEEMIPDVQEQSEILVTGLSKMGFKKSEINKFVKSIGNRVSTDPIQKLMVEGIQKLAS